MSADKYPSIFSHQMKAIVYISIMFGFWSDPYNEHLLVGDLSELVAKY